MGPFTHGPRFEAWVEGLNGDWNICRQRYFGVPFPLWYPIHRTAGRRRIRLPTRTSSPSTRV